MSRYMGLLALAGFLGGATTCPAQVFVRAPFVRVQVGPGVWVRAPFVNIWVPPRRGYFLVPPPGYGYVLPPTPGYVFPAPPASVPPKQPPKQEPPQTEEPPPPRPTSENPLTLQDFAKSFKAQEGNYQLTLINPVTNLPTQVRFSLPAGTPRRVIVRQEEIEFSYGPRHFVRLQFDKDGAMVTSR